MEQGEAVARALGPCQGVFMLSNGIAPVGPDVGYGSLSTLFMAKSRRS